MPGWSRSASQARLNQIATQRRESEDKMLLQGNVPFRHTDPAKTLKIELHDHLPSELVYERELLICRI